MKQRILHIINAILYFISSLLWSIIDREFNLILIVPLLFSLFIFFKKDYNNKYTLWGSSIGFIGVFPFIFWLFLASISIYFESDYISYILLLLGFNPFFFPSLFILVSISLLLILIGIIKARINKKKQINN